MARGPVIGSTQEGGKEAGLKKETDTQKDHRKSPLIREKKKKNLIIYVQFSFFLFSFWRSFCFTTLFLDYENHLNENK